MKTSVGLWIDHKKAMIVAITDRGEEIKLIVSKVEKQLRRSGTEPFEGGNKSGQAPPADDSRQRSFTAHLNIYYEAVIACLRDAESVLIFGPGEAKGELKKRLLKNHMGGRIAGVETADRMTDRQIAAKVRRHFEEKRTAKGSRPNQPMGASTGRGKTRPAKTRQALVPKRQ